MGMFICLLRVIYSFIYTYKDNDKGCILYVTGNKNEDLIAKIIQTRETIYSNELELDLTKYVIKYKEITLE